MVRCEACGRRISSDFEDEAIYFPEEGIYICSDEEKFQFVDDRFDNYLIQNNVAEKVKQMAANPSLDEVIKLEKVLNEVGADETGEAQDSNDVGGVVGPLYEIRVAMQMGMNEELPVLFRELLEGIDEATHPDVKFSPQDKKFLRTKLIRGNQS
jgi:hypothetical protein